MVLALVINPGHPKNDAALWLYDSLQDFLRLVFRLCFDYRSNGLEHFLGGLQKLALPGIASLEIIEHLLDVGIHSPLLEGF